MVDDVNRVSGKKNKTNNLILFNFKILKLKKLLNTCFCFGMKVSQQSPKINIPLFIKLR
jgi:hypothetical protein